MKGNIPSIGLDTTAALAASENKRPNVAILFKKIDFDAKLLDTEKKNVLRLIITNLLVIYLMQRLKKRGWLINLLFLDS